MSILPIKPILKASPSVTTLLGTNPRIYEDIAPEGTEVPYIVWQELGGQANNHLDNAPANFDDVQFQVMVYDTYVGRAYEVREAVRKALESYCFILNPRISGFDPTTKQSMRGFDANWIQEI
ncbi:DUF3168 domain-containing protein [Acinetobacter sp. NIPH 298]|uniref:DUF3168 domain-containing protein n=1 Tax=Acinetobacter sp. NIPH 298 TaxID=1217692 RepID=UPI0002CE4AE6|nr:DUF3168 domain-containing protein [Acinetobacter sp. NIPH 298]ENW95970.1 hypothetical protein F903_01738 [Acinetobacter sp. NIPH 298]